MYDELRLKIIWEELKDLSLKKEKVKVLDIGFAQNPLPFSDINIELYGADIQKTRRPKNYKKTIICDVENKIPFEKSKFDAVICGDLIEHLENPYRFLRGVHSIIKDNGLLILTTPNIHSFDYFLYNLRWKKTPHHKEHMHWFSLQGIKTLMHSTGFRTKTIRGTFCRIPVLNKLIEIKNPLISNELFIVAKKANKPPPMKYVRDKKTLKLKQMRVS